jgi:hypothetical protein
LGRFRLALFSGLSPKDTLKYAIQIAYSLARGAMLAKVSIDAHTLGNELALWVGSAVARCRFPQGAFPLTPYCQRP